MTARPRLRILSLGAGVQSSTLLLASANGLPPQGMTRSGTAYAPATSVPRTAVRGSLLLPTPQARDHHGAHSPDRRGHQVNLNDIALRLLPTPRASDGTHGSPGQRGSRGDLTFPSASLQTGVLTQRRFPGGRPSSAAPRPLRPSRGRPVGHG
jgi:hypothetical protein